MLKNIKSIVGVGLSLLIGLSCALLGGCQLNGKISLGFEDFRIEPKYREYSVTWVDSDGTVLETDEKLNTNDKAFYNGELPKKEGYDFIGFDNATTNSVGYYCVTVEMENITCTAQYEAHEVKGSIPTNA